MKAILIFDIDGVVRDVGASYRRAIADTVEYFTQQAYRPSLADIDELKSEGIWNNDWKASEELIYRYFEDKNQNREEINLDYGAIVAFFQARYRGANFDGYITTEPLLLSRDYLENLTKFNIGWGFFSGATRGSAEFVLKKRIGLENPVLIAMEDAPSKPDPKGLFDAVGQICSQNVPVIYVGDTVADIYTVIKAREKEPSRHWVGVGVLPPHVQENQAIAEAYGSKLKEAKATVVIDNVEKLTPELIESLLD
jgi:HAD superfamily phosphatase